MSKWTRLFSAKQWLNVFRKLPGLLTARELPLREKLLFVIPVIVYWVMPDFIPFMPIDDIGVTLLMMNWFVSRAENKMSIIQYQPQR